VVGQVVNKTPQNPPHAVTIRLVSKALEQLCGEVRDLRVQLPIALSDLSEPEPDLAVVRGKPVDYLDEHPRPDQIVLLVVVSDSTLERDRRRKLPLYAAAGVGEVWLVDLVARRLETHREPSLKGFGRTTILLVDHSLAPLFAPDSEIKIVDLLPPLRALAGEL
jgi:Uma2 family endonuclease